MVPTFSAPGFVLAVATRLVLDVKALPELVAEFFRDDPRRDIGDAAGRKR
jgi:hypothetical protein